MKDLGITKGEFKPYESAPDKRTRSLYGKSGISIEESHEVFLAYGRTIEKAEANAQLFADAGTTANKCGKLPSDLLRERTELLTALDSAITGLEWEIESFPEKDHKADEEKLHEWKKLIQSIVKS